MTRDEIDVMWQQALRDSVKDGEMFTRYHFAELVAKKTASDESDLLTIAHMDGYSRGVNDGMRAENEACANLCERFANRMMNAKECADAIRSRRKP